MRNEEGGIASTPGEMQRFRVFSDLITLDLIGYLHRAVVRAN
jgi:hypothetical protein